MTKKNAPIADRARRNYIEEAWNSFKHDVLPPSLPRPAINEVQKIFYCGAAVVISLISDAKQDTSVLIDARDELQAFGRHHQAKAKPPDAVDEDF